MRFHYKLASGNQGKQHLVTVCQEFQTDGGGSIKGNISTKTLKRRKSASKRTKHSFLGATTSLKINIRPLHGLNGYIQINAAPGFCVIN